MALATRALLSSEPQANVTPALDPDGVLKIAERVMREATRCEAAGDLGPDDARALLMAFVEALEEPRIKLVRAA